MSTGSLFQNPSTVDWSQGVALYGAGGAGRRAATAIRSTGAHVYNFLDQAKAGQTVEGVEVLAPDSPDAAYLKNRPVVISIFNRDVPIRHIAKTLTLLGYKCLVSYVDLHDYLRGALAQEFWLTDRSVLSRNAAEIDRFRALLCDPVSRKVLDDVVAFRKSGTFEREPQPDIFHQYFPTDLPPWIGDQPLRFVDCGAFNGDTLQQLRQLGLAADAIAAFEPDPSNFSVLASSVRSNIETMKDVVLWPCGVGEQNEILAFESDGGEGGKFGSGSKLLVPSVTLDDVVFGMRPTHIKMDVEGAEVSALRGCRQIIDYFAPHLAISIYHTPEHLWDIPLMLHEWQPRYSFHLRSHGYQTFDTILYAIATE